MLLKLSKGDTLT